MSNNNDDSKYRHKARSSPRLFILTAIAVVFAWSQRHSLQGTDDALQSLSSSAGGSRQYRLKRRVDENGGAARNDDDGDNADVRNDKMDVDTSPIVFVSLLGLEGTGHHLYQQIYEQSPSHQRLVEWNLYPNVVQKLTRLLWNQGKPHQALLSAPCAKTTQIDLMAMMDQLVGLLRHVHNEISQHLEDDASATSKIAVPLTSVRFRRKGKTGYMSYPNYRGDCRALQYPDLLLLERACEEAAVQCQHIVTHRDEWEVLRSTLVHRNFDEFPLRQVKTLTTMAHVLHSQISHTKKNRVAACWNFNEEEEEDDDNEASKAVWYRRAAPLDVGRLLGWRDDDDDDEDKSISPNHTMAHFVHVYRSNFHANVSSILSQDEKDSIVPRSMQIYVDSFVDASHQLRNTCERLLQQGNGKEKQKQQGRNIQPPS